MKYFSSQVNKQVMIGRRIRISYNLVCVLVLAFWTDGLLPIYSSILRKSLREPFTLV